MDDETQKRKEGGRFEASTTHNDVMAVFDQVEGPVVTSSDVAEECDCSPKTAKRKLSEIEDKGRIKGRETAGRTVWWIVEQEEVIDDE
jgi:CTP-dependent riboflavin kinase